MLRGKNVMDLTYVNNKEKSRRFSFGKNGKDGSAFSASYVRKPFYTFVKRGLDIVCSIVALILLSPLMIITAIAIFIDDPGPVLFRQIRIGKDKKPFKILKFRSMKMNAEKVKASLMKQNQDKGANFKMDHDPRVTRVGRIIRATSIDELPQLINIIKGDMAVIGPRPFIEEEQKKLPSDRLLVKPGLSCYWQISGKNNLSLPEQINLDRKYINERSLIVDTKIVFLTFSHVFTGKNE